MADPAVRFLLQRRLDRRDGSDLGLVSELHGRAQADGWIGIGELRLRLVGVEERLDHEPQPTVGRHLLQVRQRHGAEWLPVVRAGDIDHIPVAARSLRAADDQLGRARARARVDATAAQRLEELDPLGIAGLAEDGDGRLAAIGVLTDEIRQRARHLGGPRGRRRVARRSRGEPRDQRKENDETVSHAFF